MIELILDCPLQGSLRGTKLLRACSFGLQLMALKIADGKAWLGKMMDWWYLKNWESRIPLLPNGPALSPWHLWQNAAPLQTRAQSSRRKASRMPGTDNAATCFLSFHCPQLSHSPKWVSSIASRFALQTGANRRKITSLILHNPLCPPQQSLRPKFAALIRSQWYRTRQSIPFIAVHRINHWHFRSEKSWVPTAAKSTARAACSWPWLVARRWGWMGRAACVNCSFPLWSMPVSGWFSTGNIKIHAGISSTPSHVFGSIPGLVRHLKTNVHAREGRVREPSYKNYQLPRGLLTF